MKYKNIDFGKCRNKDCDCHKHSIPEKTKDIFLGKFYGMDVFVRDDTGQKDEVFIERFKWWRENEKALAVCKYAEEIDEALQRLLKRAKRFRNITFALDAMLVIITIAVIMITINLP